MDEKVWDEVQKVMRKIKPFIALAILIFIVLSTVNLYKYNLLQEEIKDSCGYQKNEKVYCVCDRDWVKQVDLSNNPYYEEPTGEWDLNNS